MKSTRKGVQQPIFWIVAGPNGSGKSTVYGRNDVAGLDGSVWFINPDLLTVRIQDAEALDLQAANLAAVERIEAWLDASIEAHQTIGVETVLSSPKYRRLVTKAKERGFIVHFIYVILRDAEMQLERIRVRVAKGGHDVPPDKVRSRRTRSIVQSLWFMEQADRFWVFDNSGAELGLIGEGDEAEASFSSKAPPDFLAAVEWGWSEGMDADEITSRLLA
ncbi:MAG TPA: zeta toxin family protein [Sphingopyxis sp.]|nr:zeta toxin family protein [Sphingopyxis sp.]HMQ17946.1 zeta toxin family protein [Sphingopyxis sp.]